MAANLTSLSSLLAILSGTLLFVGACYLVATRRRPAILAAYLVLLPMPLMISVFGFLYGVIRSLVFIANTPNLVMTNQEIAAACAGSLTSVLAAVMVSAPTYIVVAIGLLVRTMHDFPTTSNAPITSPAKATEIAGAPVTFLKSAVMG